MPQVESISASFSVKVTTTDKKRPTTIGAAPSWAPNAPRCPAPLSLSLSRPCGGRVTDRNIIFFPASLRLRRVQRISVNTRQNFFLGVVLVCDSNYIRHSLESLMAFLKTWPSLHLQQVYGYVGRTGASGRSIHLIVRLLTYDESREGRTDCDHRGRATRWGREAAAVGGQEGARKDCSGSTHHFQFFPSLSFPCAVMAMQPIPIPSEHRTELMQNWEGGREEEEHTA